MKVTKPIRVDLSTRGCIARIDAVQGDTAREVAISLYSNGVAWDVPDGAAVLIRFRKFDGKGGTYDSLPDGSKAYSTSGNVLNITLAPQVLTAEGSTTIQVAFLQASDIIATFPMSIQVQPDPSLGTVKSEDYTSIGEWVLPAATEAANKALFYTTKAEAAVQQAEKAAQQATNADQQVTVPDYWQSCLDGRVEDIRRAMESAGRNKSSFFFYSDAHWDNDNTDTVRMAPKLLKYLYRKTPINKTAFGGDIVHGTGSTNTEDMKYLGDWREALRGLPNHHSVIGNHDDGNGEMDRQLSKEYVYTYLLAPEESNDVVYGGDFYYYVDDNAEKTRYLYLDIFYDWVSAEQQSFVKEAIKFVENGWHIVAICHAWFDVSYDTYPPVITGLASKLQPILDMFDNYNARVDEFSTCGGKVELCIGGHYHLDHSGRTDGGIPVVIVEADTFHNRSGTWPQRNTIEESSVNAVICDYNEQKVKIIRIGRGNSFTLDMSSGDATVSYSITSNLTNVTSSSAVTSIEANQPYSTTLTATVGTITNVAVTMGGVDITASVYKADTGALTIDAVTGDVVITAVAEATQPSYTNVLDTVGYTNNKRFGSDGTERDNTGSSITGFIPASPGDYIYLKNITMNVGADNYGNGLFYYDTNKSKVQGYYITADKTNTYQADSRGNITRIFVDSYVSGTAYVRLSVAAIDDTSIITVNEPIE